MLIKSINRFYRTFHILDLDHPNSYIQLYSLPTDIGELTDIKYDIHCAINDSGIILNDRDLKWLNKLYHKLESYINKLDTRHEEIAEQLQSFLDSNGLDREVEATDLRTLQGRLEWIRYIDDIDRGNHTIQKLRQAIKNL